MPGPTAGANGYHDDRASELCAPDSFPCLYQKTPPQNPETPPPASQQANGASAAEGGARDLGARTAEAQQLRRDTLRGARIVHITGGYASKSFIFERSKELGVKTVVLDEPDKEYVKKMEARGVIEKFVPCDLSQTKGVFERCLAEIKRIEKELGPITAVCSFDESCQTLVARLAQQLHLPGNPPAAIDTAREKATTRQVMARAGLPSPPSFKINGPEDLERAARAVGFPAVLKPVTGAAAMGVVRVDSGEALPGVYKKLRKEVASIVVTEDGDWVVQSHHDDVSKDDVAPKGLYCADGEAISQTFVLEAYLDGPEVAVDLILSEGGGCVYGHLYDFWPSSEPYFSETGVNSPSVLPHQQQVELCQLAVNTVRCLGLQTGVFHVQMKYTSRGPHLIEVNTRMGGHYVYRLNKAVWGVDLVEEQLLACCGIPSKPVTAPRPLHHVAVCSANAKASGVLSNNDFLKEWSNHPDVMHVQYLVAPGQNVTCIKEGLPTRVFEVMVCKPTVKEAIEFAKHIEDSVTLPLVPSTANGA